MGLLTQAGCFAAPLALPPLEASYDIQARAASVRSERSSDDIAAAGIEPSHAVHTIHLGVNPFQAFGAQTDRRFDASAGYHLEWLPDRFSSSTRLSMHGAYARVSAYPFYSPRNQGRMRISAEASFHMWGDIPGAGTSLGLGYEFRRYLRSRDFSEVATGNRAMVIAAGRSRGEGAVGLEFVFGYRVLRGFRYATLGLGLTVRIPATGGFIAGVGIPR